jgi:hypothetical protein
MIHLNSGNYMKQFLFDRSYSVLGSKNIIKIYLAPDLPVNFNLARIRLNLYKFKGIFIEILKL